MIREQFSTSFRSVVFFLLFIHLFFFTAFPLLFLLSFIYLFIYTTYFVFLCFSSFFFLYATSASYHLLFVYVPFSKYIISMCCFAFLFVWNLNTHRIPYTHTVLLWSILYVYTQYDINFNETIANTQTHIDILNMLIKKIRM